MIVMLGQNEAADAITCRVALEKFIQDHRKVEGEYTQAFYERTRIPPAVKMIAAIDDALEAQGLARLEPVT